MLCFLGLKTSESSLMLLQLQGNETSIIFLAFRRPDIVTLERWSGI